MPPQGRDTTVDSTIVTMLWTTVLFGAMWFGQNWARYIYVLLMVSAVVFSVPLFFSFETTVHTSWKPVILLGGLIAFHIAVLVTLVFSPAVQALVKNR